MNEERERANRPGGPEFGDTTPGYGGPNPDPRGPALGDDRQDEDDEPAPSAATTPDPDDLPFSDTTPPYAGPNPDPRGPALGSGDNDNHAGLIAAGTIGAGFAAADGPFPIGDLIGLGIIGYAGYKAITNPPSLGPIFNQNTGENPENITDQPTRPADKPGKIAAETGLTEKEVKDRIHDAKKNMPRGGDVRNPDVAVDLDTGEIHPKNKDGTYGDSIGNIFDD